MKNKNFLVPLAIVWLGILSCRPVIAIGWGEFFFLVFVIALLIGPPLYRLVRRMNIQRENGRKDKSSK